jgi:hypothetical protein
MVNLPALLIGLILATLYGAAFHLIRGGNLGKLALYIVLSWFGFWTGNFIANQLGWDFLTIGTLNIGLATIFSWIFLILGNWLSLVAPSQSKPPASRN